MWVATHLPSVLWGMECNISSQEIENKMQNNRREGRSGSKSHLCGEDLVGEVARKAAAGILPASSDYNQEASSRAPSRDTGKACLPRASIGTHGLMSRHQKASVLTDITKSSPQPHAFAGGL